MGNEPADADKRRLNLVQITPLQLDKAIKGQPPQVEGAAEEALAARLAALKTMVSNLDSVHSADLNNTKFMTRGDLLLAGSSLQLHFDINGVPYFNLKEFFDFLIVVHESMHHMQAEAPAFCRNLMRD